MPIGDIIDNIEEIKSLTKVVYSPAHTLIQRYDTATSSLIARYSTRWLDSMWCGCALSNGGGFRKKKCSEEDSSVV